MKPGQGEQSSAVSTPRNPLRTVHLICSVDRLLSIAGRNYCYAWVEHAIFRLSLKSDLAGFRHNGAERPRGRRPAVDAVKPRFTEPLRRVKPRAISRGNPRDQASSSAQSA